MIHVSARAPRWPNAVSPGATRSIAPPSQPVITCACGVGTRLEAGEQRVDEAVADLVQVVQAVVEAASRAAPSASSIDCSATYGIGPTRSSAGGQPARSGASTRSPSAMSPLHATPTTATRRPCSSGGNGASGGAVSSDVEDRQLVGRAGHQRRGWRAAPRAPAPTGRRACPPSTIGPTAVRRGTRSSSRRRSRRRRRAAPRTGRGARRREARTMRPSASTTSAASSESIVRPWWRISQPMPPPSVSPPTPVCEIWPAGHGEPVLLRRGVELAEQRAAADAHDGASRGRPRRR